MRYDKFTTKLQEALADAQSLALGRTTSRSSPAPVARAAQPGGRRGRFAHRQGGGQPPCAQAGPDQAIGRLPKVEGTPGEVHLSRDLGNLLNVADKDAQKRGDQYIASELFLLACAGDKGKSAGF